MKHLRQLARSLALLFFSSILTMTRNAQEQDADESATSVSVGSGILLRSSPVLVDATVIRNADSAGEIFELLGIVEGEFLSFDGINSNEWYRVRTEAGEEAYIWTGVARLEPMTAAPEPDVVQWGYEGTQGPEHWATLTKGFCLCAEGRAQSPIDLSAEDALTGNLTAIVFDYHETPLLIFNNGHTIEVEYEPGSSITYNETVYNLIQFHFHCPSEHTVNGQAADMELHLVHISTDGKLAVVAILLNATAAHNTDFDTMLRHLPVEAGKGNEATREMIDASHFLPENRHYFAYEGSLTTPPCTEGVRWLVLQEPVAVTSDLVEIFASIFSSNNRPLQPRNERDILQHVD